MVVSRGGAKRPSSAAGGPRGRGRWLLWVQARPLPKGRVRAMLHCAAVPSHTSAPGRRVPDNRWQAACRAPARKEGPGGVGASRWTLCGIPNSWLPSLRSTGIPALRHLRCRGRWFGLRGLRDLDLDEEWTKTGLRLRQPHNSHTNDDGDLPPLAPVAQSL